MRWSRSWALLLMAAAGCSSADSWAPGKAADPGSVDVAVTGGMAGPAATMSYPQAELSTRSTGADESDREESSGNRYAKLAEHSPAEAPAPSPPPPPPGQQQPPKPKPGPGGVVEDPSRKQPILIYTADFSLSVYEVQKSLDAIDGIAKAKGGYLSRRDDRSITIRVPAEAFQEVTAEIEKVGDVLSRNVVSEDVTAEYRDLEVQLANALALRSRFEKLLEKALKVEEALAIEQQLGRVTGEIERIKGRLKLLSDQARYSTVTVRFQAKSSQQVQQGPFVLPLPWVNQVGLRRLMSL